MKQIICALLVAALCLPGLAESGAAAALLERAGIEADAGLLARVVEFKEKFYRTPWARLAEARPGTLRLVPPASRVPELAADYAAMRPMLFGEFPSLGEIVAYLGGLEERINALG